jgi:hypothetical protein
VGAQRRPWPPLETMSFTPAEALRQLTLQGWRLSCSSKEEDTATKARAKVATAAGMSLRQQLQEQALDGKMRVDGGRRRTR